MKITIEEMSDDLWQFRGIVLKALSEYLKNDMNKHDPGVKKALLYAISSKSKGQRVADVRIYKTKNGNVTVKIKKHETTDQKKNKTNT